ncbi:MAG: hypothetical protein KDA75_19700, partial [Planctomycetaceae bacterium]|nr:hypothetical protein [Planctomycetaceae bacterium]
MSFTVLDIPEDHAELATWLEQRLVDLDLADVVAGLEVFESRPADATSLLEILGDNRQDVLTQGLAALDSGQVQQLLRHPRLLLQLQELVLADGGPYWRRLPVSQELQRLVNTGWDPVNPAVDATAHQTTAVGGG